MPRFDGTGPMGLGEMTGRGIGYCSGFYPRERGNYGAGFGRGFGCRRNRFIYESRELPRWARYKNNIDKEIEEVSFNEERYLKDQEELLENQLKQIKDQLKKLSEDGEDSSGEVD